MRGYLWRVVAGLLIIITGVVLLAAALGWVSLESDLFGVLAPFGGAAIFLAVWLGDTSQWWPLIPGGLMFAGGVSSLFGLLGIADWLTSLIALGGGALPFLYIYLRNRKANWWALIPGGLLLGIGVTSALADLVGGAWEATFVLWGIAAVFAVAFLANRRNSWALLPAAVLALVGLGVSPFGFSVGLLFGAGLIVLGALIILRVVLVRP